MALPLITLLGTLGTAIVDGVKGHFERKHELKQAEHEAHIKRIAEGDAHASRLDEISISQRGWKDEYLLLLTTLPLVLLFAAPLLQLTSVAGIQAAVIAGFEALALTPEYYWYALAIIYIDTFGFRRMLRVAFEAFVRKKFGGTE